MIALLVTFSVIEIALVVTVLAVYLILIDKHLKVISTWLGKVAFGVRAVNTQTASIGPSVVRINTTLREIDAALGPIAEKANRVAERG
ncbi:MAG: hypothetical protein GEU83_15920 [Pseudonocardiaceae bacterium]|nr:hypothetical protein [Pseudonocardiaceae bacterium]